jgi:hypothetical protein
MNYTLGLATEGFLPCDDNVTLAVAVSGYLCIDSAPIVFPDIFRPEGIIGGSKDYKKSTVKDKSINRNLDNRKIEDNEILTIIKIFLNLQ